MVSEPADEQASVPQLPQDAAATQRSHLWAYQTAQIQRRALT